MTLKSVASSRYFCQVSDYEEGSFEIKMPETNGAEAAFVIVRQKRPADRHRIARKCPLTMMTREALFPHFFWQSKPMPPRKIA